MEATSRLHQGDRAASIGPRSRGRENSKHALARMVDEGAAIGPRPRGRGNLASEGKVAPNEKLQLGLDLAVEETMLPALLALTTEALQLGLDLAVEETGTLEYLRKVGAVASIGPRPRGRGNEGMQAHSSSSLPSLQLGLDLAVEETRDGRARRDR